MSHSKERHEKICLNCEAELSGRYCHVCGQENIEPKESVWGLVSHFFYDITHFDGKFFSTTKYLITRPGFLPAEYIRGRRARYLHPIRMYVFSSALFFLIFFMLVKPKELIKGDWNTTREKIKDSLSYINYAQNAVLQTARSKEDSLEIINSFALAKDKIKNSNQKQEKAKDSVTKEWRYKKDSTKAARKKVNLIDSGDTTDVDTDDDRDENINIGFFDKRTKFKTVEAYDSAQKALPAGERDGWWERKVQRRNIELLNRYRGKDKEFIQDLIDKFIHMLPYLLFFSLPLYALFMKLLYIRHKRFYYVDHGIFFIYLYIFTFIFFLVYFSVMELRIYTHQSWIGWIEALLFLAGAYYAYKAMRKFYLQSRAMTLLKFFLLNLLAFFTLMFLFVFFFTLTVFRV
ncbi:MAG: DUF3667 domain-containing protein [Niastella sp.]|nr:DUF3667 domain-containing protein [Niastella sp.]